MHLLRSVSFTDSRCHSHPRVHIRVCSRCICSKGFDESIMTWVHYNLIQSSFLALKNPLRSIFLIPPSPPLTSADLTTSIVLPFLEYLIVGIASSAIPGCSLFGLASFIYRCATHTCLWFSSIIQQLWMSQWPQTMVYCSEALTDVGSSGAGVAHPRSLPGGPPAHPLQESPHPTHARVLRYPWVLGAHNRAPRPWLWALRQCRTGWSCVEFKTENTLDSALGELSRENGFFFFF